MVHHLMVHHLMVRHLMVHHEPDGDGGARLRTTALEVARQRGFTCVLVEPAHAAAMHIWTKKLSGEARLQAGLGPAESDGGVFDFVHPYLEVFLMMCTHI